MRTRVGPVRGSLYRAGLIGATIAGVRALEWVQRRTAIPTHPGALQTIVRTLELSWLLCLPIAAALWIGWFVFAEAVRPEPLPVPAPTDDGPPARLVFRFVTRGDNTDALRRSIETLRDSLAAYPFPLPETPVQVVTDRPTGLGDEVDEVLVPEDYEPPRGSRFKARAISYLQRERHAGPADWFVYLDEESRVGGSFLAGALTFVAQAIREARIRGGPAPVGQGTIVYDGGHWLFRGADGLRTADDLGRFRLQYALGVPAFGVHGSFLVVRGADDPDLSFDVGTRGSLTEDAAWALRAWARGVRFRWVRGSLHEQPPQTVADFRRQRGRWIAGLRRVCADADIPLRKRATLLVAVALWQLSFLPLVIALLAVVTRQPPTGWMRGPADFALTAFVLAYAQGAAVREARSLRPARDGRDLPAAVRTAAAALLCVPFIWYVTLEACGVVQALRPHRRFHVIAKPDLTPLLSPAAGRP